METRKKGKATIGIAMAAIMLASVFAATVPIISAESRGDNFNHIVKQAEPQKVLIGQNLQFEGFDVPPTVYRFVSGDIENTYKANDDSRIYNVNWPTWGVYYVNCNRSNLTDCDAPLLVEYAYIPLELKDVDTTLIVDTTRINLLPQDLVDLVIIGPDGQIKIDKMNNQTFTNITVSQLMVFGDAGLKTEGWKVGNYTFQVKTWSANACGLEAASAVRNLEILKGREFIIIKHVHNLNTGENFSSIQAAIDDNDTEDGHTITVDAGTYYENVVVDRSVTLKGIEHPVVDAGGKRNAITLTADGITLEGFNATNSGSSRGDVGIKVTSNNNTITGNNVSNNNYGGICLDDSSNNRITGNNICNNGGRGISLDDSSNNTIIGNTFVNDGLSVRDSYQNTVEDNIVNGKPLVYLEDVSDYKVKDAGQVILVNCNNITIENLDLSNTSGGIALWKTENSKISNNNVCNNNFDGIYLSYSSNNNTITGNNVRNNNRDGICLSYSSNNTITGNNVSNNNGEGIHLFYSCNNNAIAGNVFVNDGLSVYPFYQNTVEDNTVNGKPLVYLEDVSDYKVKDAGQVILVNCNNITIENLDLSNTDVGIMLWKTENSKISNNTVCNNNEEGIYLSYSSNYNTITGNNVRNNNRDGICLSYSSNNTITGNNVSNNGGNGIYLQDSNNNRITDNEASNNDNNGISLGSSNNNEIRNNSVNYNHYQGIGLWTSDENIIANNRVKNNTRGIYLFWNSSNNRIISNNASKNEYHGIALDTSNNNEIRNNTANSNNQYQGIGVWTSNENIIANNTAKNNGHSGILLEESSKNIITDNRVKNNTRGIYLLKNSTNNRIISNNASKNEYHGIALDTSNINEIRNNRANSNNYYGIGLWTSEGNIIANNTAKNNGNEGIYLWSSRNNNIITGNNVCNNGGAISLWCDSSSNTVTGNNVCNNWRGIALGDSSNNTIAGNNICNNSDGIALGYSNSNSIAGNNISNNSDGISLFFNSRNNSITGNNVSNNRHYGIGLDSSSNNSITGNIFINDDLTFDSSYHNTVEDNIVNGKPLVYLEDVSDYKVEDAGQVILVNCNNITVKNLDLSSTSVGIKLLETEDCIILNNTLSGNSISLSYSSNNSFNGNKVSDNGFGLDLMDSSIKTFDFFCRNMSTHLSKRAMYNILSNNYRGISLSYSSNNTFTDNKVSNNSDGIYIYSSSNNTIIGNNFSNNDIGIDLSRSSNSTIKGNNIYNNMKGIDLSASSNNTITGNNICNNNSGIYLSYLYTITYNNISNNDDGIYFNSTNNKIFLNNFINNINNAYSCNSTNIWNSTEEISYIYNGSTFTNYLGNYWSDYEEKYPDAEEIDTTGIWDTPYRIGRDNDNYPLMVRFENYITP